MHLYLNNYRSFKKSYFDFSGTTFLVGENSTGKSSVLSILRVLNTPGFWFSKKLLTDEDVELGAFNELTEKGNTSFEVGISIPCPQYIYRSFKVTFSGAKNGMPALEELIFSQGSILCRIFKKNKKLKVIYKKIRPVSSKMAGQKRLKKIVNEDWESYKELEGKVHSVIFDEIPLIFLIDYISDSISIEMGGKKKKDNAKKESGHMGPMQLSPVSYVAPIRQKPKRIYETRDSKGKFDGGNTPFLLKDILSQNTHKKFKKALNDFGKESGMYDSIEIKNYTQEKNSPFFINIRLGGRLRHITNVGQGVGQVLPVIIDSTLTNDDSVILIEQPEVHLHPRAQSALGKLVARLSIDNRKIFVIETHSDFVIDAFRLEVKKSKINIKASTYFFERTLKKNKSTRIGISNSGAFDDKQPAKFRDFFIKHSLKMLEL